MAKIHGKGGDVYGIDVVVDDCEDAWDEGGADAGSTPSTTAGKVGTNAARATTVAVGAVATLMNEAVASTDYSAYGAAVFWARSSLASLIAGDLQLRVDDTAQTVSPLETLDLGAMATADTWYRHLSKFVTPANLTAVISLGLGQVNDLGDGTFDIDDVRFVKRIAGINAWTLSYDGEAAEVTDFASDGTKEYIPGASGWAGTFAGFKDGPPLDINAEVVMAFQEGPAVGQSYLGNVIITNQSTDVNSAGVITYSYTFTGTGDLQIPTA
jgi:hypothetical protein